MMQIRNKIERTFTGRLLKTLLFRKRNLLTLHPTNCPIPQENRTARGLIRSDNDAADYDVVACRDQAANTDIGQDQTDLVRRKRPVVSGATAVVSRSGKGASLFIPVIAQCGRRSQLRAMNSLLFRVAAALCFFGVALGAFGAHALKGTLQAHGTTDVWNKAVLYHFVHALAFLVLAALPVASRAASSLFFVWDRAFQRQPLSPCPNEHKMARRDHAARRSLFPRWLGLSRRLAAALSGTLVAGRPALLLCLSEYVCLG